MDFTTTVFEFTRAGLRLIGRLVDSVKIKSLSFHSAFIPKKVPINHREQLKGLITRSDLYNANKAWDNIFHIK